MDPKDRNLPDEADDMDELLEKMDEEYELMEVTLFISAVVGGGLAAWISTSEGRILSFPVVAVRIALRMLSASGCWLMEEDCDMAGFNMELELDRGENIVRGDWRPLGRPAISSIDGRLLTHEREVHEAGRRTASGPSGRATSPAFWCWFCGWWWLAEHTSVSGSQSKDGILLRCANDRSNGLRNCKAESESDRSSPVGSEA